jgi:hypothetical protein
MNRATNEIIAEKHRLKSPQFLAKLEKETAGENATSSKGFKGTCPTSVYAELGFVKQESHGEQVIPGAERWFRGLPKGIKSRLDIKLAFPG